MMCQHVIFQTKLYIITVRQTNKNCPCKQMMRCNNVIFQTKHHKIILVKRWCANMKYHFPGKTLGKLIAITKEVDFISINLLKMFHLFGVLISKIAPCWSFQRQITCSRTMCKIEDVFCSDIKQASKVNVEAYKRVDGQSWLI